MQTNISYMNNKNIERARSKRIKKEIKREISRNYQLYLIILLPVLYITIFHYIPMYGVQIAFKNFRAVDGIWGSPWVGFEHFEKFLGAYQFNRILRNTISISVYSLLAGFPIPIILALALNNMQNLAYKKTVQMVTYAPYFISTVVMVGMILQFLSPKFGIINQVVELFGFQPILFMSEPNYFSSIYVWSGIWQGAGWGSIIYLAALAGIDPTLHEAAIIDGATKLQRTFYIDIPGIMPTAVILLILNAGQIMNVGFEKVLLMQNSLNIQKSEVISTYVYKVGLASQIPRYSYGAAIGLFNAVINLVLMLIVNRIASRLTETSLW
jgi:putative aldouronate transport system permease protein